jgi:copper transport protein
MSAIRRVAAAMLIGLGVIVASAVPATAHAVLLRTEPSPQSTVARAPPSVRLEFSEPVETAFGAVRVFDVDGHRVDRGKVARAPAGRMVEVPLPPLRDGTYTVTWRVVSADGHEVHGGFVFYVGAPSTISPVAVAGDSGGGRALGWAFGVVRFAWFSALLGLVGLAVARRLVWTPALRATGLADGDVAAGFRARFARAMPAAWVVLFVAGALSIVFQAAAASGLPLGRAASPSVIGEVLGTAYGRSWMVAMVLTVVALAPVLALSRPRPVLPGRPPVWLVVLGVLATGLCVTAALSGHARTDPHPLVAETSVVVHLLAAGCWVGGLTALVVLGGRGWRGVPEDRRAAFLRDLVARFSRVAMIAAAVVVVSGGVNTWTATAAVSDLWRTPYGRLVAAKVVLVVLALGLAARHLRVTPRDLSADGEPAGRAVRTFARTSAVELAVLVAAVAVASGLVVAVPGRSLALASQGPVSVERRIGPSTVQLFIDPSTVGPNQIHLTFVNDAGLAAADVTTVTVRMTPPGGPPEPVAMRLIAPGHFAGDTDLPRPGPYRLVVETGAAGARATKTFTFTLSRRAR